MSLSFLAVGYEDANFGGMQRLFGIGNSARYSLFNAALLGDLSFDKAMSSLRLHASDTASANIIAFSNDIAGGPTTGDFAGDYLQFITARHGAEIRVNLLDFQFNDRTRSILLVNTNRAPEFRVSFRDQFLDTWNTTLDPLLGSQASRKGDPLMTWTAFPEGTSYLASDQIYLQITQALNINLDWWPDYNATVTYHLYLYLDGSRQLQGYCQRWAAWVEGGIKHDQILDKLWDKVVAGVAIINGKLKANLAGLPAFNDFYYLPGRQLAPLDDVSDSEGSTWDDITLVLES